LTSATDRIDQFLRERIDDYVVETARLCAQPSVSATGVGIDACADLVVDLLEQRGLEVQKLTTKGNPVIVGRIAGESERTLLFYNHYDVQPPEPLELWTTPPFEPTVRDGALYARGAIDDKGEIVARLAALDAVRAAHDSTLPCSVLCVIEGEEEIGSPHIAQFVREHTDILACDGAVWEQGFVDHEGHPELNLGYRGILAVELTVETMQSDAHSGLAHALPNAAWQLNRLLSTLKGADERVSIPGFYSDAEPPSPLDRELLAARSDYESLWRETYGVDRFVRGLIGKELNRAVFEPTCNIQGITAGYQGQGTKTVIPAEASVKLDFRLVPDQDPDDIFDKLRAHLDEQGFEDVKLTRLAAMWPAKTNPDDPLAQLAIRTGEEVYGKSASIDPMIGGSSPVYAFAGPLGIPVINAGVGHWGGQLHAPNEHVIIENLLNGARHLARILDGFAQGQ
jgi:acetylornithine deacetylase/succinyl-diaminopimelate desuccinylase-like protein